MYGRKAGGRGLVADSITGHFLAPDGVPDAKSPTRIDDLVQAPTLLLGFEMDCQIQCLEG